MKTYTLPQNTYDQVINTLVQLPYGQVVGLLNLIGETVGEEEDVVEAASD